MKIYISHPISGYDIDERMQYGEKVAKFIETQFDNATICTPFTMHPFDNASYGECMSDCVKNLYDTDILILCQDWIKSSGCREEFFIACNHKLKIYEYTDVSFTEMTPGYKEKNMMQCAMIALN